MADVNVKNVEELVHLKPGDIHDRFLNPRVLALQKHTSTKSLQKETSTKILGASTLKNYLLDFQR